MKNKLIIIILLLATILRLVLLDKFPAGLNSDEAAIGYNAWSLLETEKDEHGVTWPLVFRSFDDYKPPVYFYLVLPFIKILGLNIWAVRLPSALLGIASVYLLYLLAKRLFSEKEYQYLPALSAFFLAISPWHLHFSRGGWEVNAATFFILLTLLYLHKSLENTKFLFVFGLSAVLSLYTYHSARIITPLLIATFAIVYFNKVKIFFEKKNLKLTLTALVFSVILALPIVFQLLSKSGQSRFSGVSIFADAGPIWQATNYRIEHNSTNPLVDVFHNRYFTYGLRFVQNYLSHYSPDFLFIDGDTIARSRVPEMGQTYLYLLPFLFLGILSLLKFDSDGKKITLAWFLIAPIAAALTYQSPHALRSQNMVIPLTLISAIGVLTFFRFIKNNLKKYFSLILLVLVTVQLYSFARYLHMYYVHYPKELSYAWQYGFDQIAKYTKANYDQYDHIIITDRYDQPYILTAFFTFYDPAVLQTELVMSTPDQYGFATGRKFGKYEFRSIKYDEDKNLPNTLLISSEEKIDDTKVINTVKSPSGETMFKFISTK
ncbi:MAG: glycosyltransferase family 39 protein [Microgenomates group bacterium]